MSATINNVRLVDGDGNVDSSWHVEPGNQGRIDWSFKLLADYISEEPEVGWHLETRGTIALWHDWNEEKIA